MEFINIDLIKGKPALIENPYPGEFVVFNNGRSIGRMVKCDEIWQMERQNVFTNHDLKLLGDRIELFIALKEFQ